MAKDMPFDDELMTLIMGVEPSEPGQHGRTQTPKPDKDAMNLVMTIRDMCDEFINRSGKESEDEDNVEETNPEKQPEEEE